MIPPALEWPLADGVRCRFSTAADGDLRDHETRQRWLNRLGLAGAAHLHQVHGRGVITVTEPGLQGQGDGLTCTDPALPLLVYGADCPGLVLQAGAILGIAHCGWRGIAAGIVEALVAAMAAQGGQVPAAWRAFIGPGICGACYEVDAPVLTACCWPPASRSPGRDADHAQLDLATAIACRLQTAGIDRISRAGVCTACDQRLWSRRHDGPGPVQGLVLWRPAGQRRSGR